MTYLYVIQVPVARDGDRTFMGRTAALDLLAHRRLLPAEVTLRLAAPVLPLSDGRLQGEPVEELTDIELVPLAYANGLRDGLKVLRGNRQRLNEAIVCADFVHTSCGGFPFFLSPCYLAHRIARRRGVPLLFVMDCDLVGKLETDQIALAPNRIKKIIWQAFARLSWHLYTDCLRSASATFLLGRGVVSRYGPYAHNPLEIYQPIVGLESLIAAPALEAKCATLRDGAPPRLCFAGRLAPEKGLQVFLAALSLLKAAGLSPQTDIYGDGPSRSDLEAQAHSLNLDGQVTFRGHREWGEELFSDLRDHHLQVVPHLTLEMTRNVFDGMASGCALIVSDTEALRQLIADSKAGVCFATGEAASLAEQLRPLLEKPEILASYIEQGFAFVQNNHRDAHIARRLTFLRDKIGLFAKLPESSWPATGAQP